MREEGKEQGKRERVIGREMEEKREQRDDEKEDNIHKYTAHIYITSRYNPCCISLLGLPAHDLCRAPAEEFSMVTTAHYVDRCTWAAEVHTF